MTRIQEIRKQIKKINKNLSLESFSYCGQYSYTITDKNNVNFILHFNSKGFSINSIDNDFFTEQLNILIEHCQAYTNTTGFYKK